MTMEKPKNMNENKSRACSSELDLSGEAHGRHSIGDGGLAETEVLTKSEERSREARLKGISQDKASADTENLSEKLVACNATIKEWQEKYMRLSADLENFKRRIAKSIISAPYH